MSMSKQEIRLTKQHQLALVIAHGKSVATWAHQNDVPKSTAYGWAKDVDVRRHVESWHRHSFDQALDEQMTRRSTQAVNTITKLANLPSPGRFKSGAAGPCWPPGSLSPSTRLLSIASASSRRIKDEG